MKREKKIKAQIFALAIGMDRGLVSETVFNDYIQALSRKSCRILFVIL